MQFTEIISYADYAIEAVGVIIVILVSIYSSVLFVRDFRQLGRSIILGSA